MKNVELYDQRFDWLVGSLAAIPLIWLFYGLDAAFVCLLLFAMIGALKPVINHLGSKLEAGIFAAGTVLLLSPLLRYVFYNGYCFDGPWSLAAEINRYQMPELCERGFFSHINQELWVGPLRDLAMPGLGLSLIFLAFLGIRQTIEQNDSNRENANYSAKHLFLQKHAVWSMFALTAIGWSAGTFVNYRAGQAELEQLRVDQVVKEAALKRERATARAAEAATAANQAKLEAAEKAAKHVDRKWLLGTWVQIEGLDAEIKSNPNIYCATDSGIKFAKNGQYNWADERGDYKLNDNHLRFTERVVEQILPEVLPERLEPSMSKVERNGNRLMIEGSTFARC
jgi:hypothetical protein